jgi:3-hydroxyacyl-[acyl-carrier-protein] dehydratase
MRRDIAKAFAHIETPTLGNLAATFLFTDDQDVFRGHFPGKPILPGVFQIEMIKFALETATGQVYRLARIDKCKFLKPVLPGQAITVNTSWVENENAIDVKGTVECDGAAAAKVSLVLIRDARE